MSFVATETELLGATATNLTGVGAAVTAQNTSAAAVAGLPPAAADQVSILTAAQFTAFGQLYQMVTRQAEVILDQFIGALRGGMDTYEITEIANVFVTGGEAM